jgi:hypothetical protein
MCSAYGQGFPVERLNNFGRQDRLELFNVRVFMPKIGKPVRL